MELTEDEIQRSQTRLAALFGDELTYCPACGELIFAADTLACKSRENCTGEIGKAKP